MQLAGQLEFVPSQSERPQLRAPWGAPATGEHVPTCIATLHASQLPVQARSQHTESTQMPDWQFEPVEHAPPVIVFATHMLVASHDDVPEQRGPSALTTALHVPAVAATSQRSQAPHVDSQQTPSWHPAVSHPSAQGLPRTWNS